MRILQIGSDRSKRGILYPDSPATHRQTMYAETFGELDIIGFSLKYDGAKAFDAGNLHVHPTNSSAKIMYPFDARRIAKSLPKSDVVSAQDPFEGGLVALWIAWMKGASLHVQVHTDFLSDEYKSLSLLNRLRTMIAGFVLRRASGIRVVSQRIKEGIEKRYDLNVPITVLPIFVDIEKFKNVQADSGLHERYAAFRTKVLVVARQEPEKNVALGIRAFVQTAPADACLIVVGNGTEHERLARVVASEHKATSIFFEDAGDIKPYYELADLVLVSSKYEGYGMVIIEALAVGKPVIATDVGIAREAGAIIANPDSFAHALSEWFKGGPRTMYLKDYPYQNEADYIQKYCASISACAKR